MQAMFSVFCSELPHPNYMPITYVNPAIPCESLSEVFAGHGFATGFITSADFAFDRKLRFYKHRRFDLLMDRSQLPHREGVWENSWGIDERVTVDTALDWFGRQVRDRPERPVFLVYQMATGHHPPALPGYQLPRGATEKEEADGRLKALGFIDESIARLYRGLDALGVMDNTLFVIFSDHGPGSGRPGMGRVRDASVYEKSVHVPLVMFGPQFRAGPHELGLPTSHIDLAPTLLGLQGIPVPDTMKGRNLIEDRRERAVIMSTRPPLSQIGVRSGPYKLVYWQETGAVELFDIDRNPDETDDLSRLRPDLVEPLFNIGLAWRNHSRNLIENYAAIRQAHPQRCDGSLARISDHE